MQHERASNSLHYDGALFTCYSYCLRGRASKEIQTLQTALDVKLDGVQDDRWDEESKSVAGVVREMASVKVEAQSLALDLAAKKEQVAVLENQVW